MGRGIRHGLFPYRDLYDHKGPLLYFLYFLGALVTEKRFLGVFLLEVISLGAVCYFSFKISTLYQNGMLAVLSVPLTAVVTVSCTAFNQGGSAEEYCLPALVLAIYCFLRLFECKSRNRDGYLFGATAGFIFLIKFTICGLHLGLGIMSVIYLVWRDDLHSACRHVVRWIVGFLAVLLPMALILFFSGTLRECIQAYFFDNLNVYEGTPLTATGHIYNALAYLRTQSAANPIVFVFAVIGFLYIALRAATGRKLNKICQALGYPVAAGIFLLFVYWGEMAHPYYALVFASLVCVGFVPVIRGIAWVSEKVAWKPLPGILLLIMLVAVLPFSACSSRVLELLNVRWNDMPQYQFSEIMHEDEDASILDVTSLDQGFYFASGILPTFRYFADNNLPSKEKENEIKRYLSEGIPGFVVSIYRDPGDKYELIAEADGLFDLAAQRHYKLYRRR